MRFFEVRWFFLVYDSSLDHMVSRAGLHNCIENWYFHLLRHFYKTVFITFSYHMCN